MVEQSPVKGKVSGSSPDLAADLSDNQNSKNCVFNLADNLKESCVLTQ